MRDLCANGMAQTSRMHLGSTRGDRRADARAILWGQMGGLSLGGVGPITETFRAGNSARSTLQCGIAPKGRRVGDI